MNWERKIKQYLVVTAYSYLHIEIPEEDFGAGSRDSAKALNRRDRVGDSTRCEQRDVRRRS